MTLRGDFLWSYGAIYHLKSLIKESPLATKTLKNQPV